MNATGRRAWFKLWAYRTLYGSTTKELDPAERWVWIGFLCLAADSPISGTICVAQDVPYTPRQLCQLLDVNLATLKRATDKMLTANKVSINGSGIHITHWAHYQGDFVRKQHQRGRVTTVTPHRPVTNDTPPVTPLREKEKEKRERELDPPPPLTPPPPAAAADAIFGQFCRIYEDNIGALVPAIATKLEELSASYSVEWFKEAVNEAVTHNARHLSYVTAVLDRWNRDGFRAQMPSKTPRNAPRNAPRPLPTSQELKQEWTPDENPK